VNSNGTGEDVTDSNRAERKIGLRGDLQRLALGRHPFTSRLTTLVSPRRSCTPPPPFLFLRRVLEALEASSPEGIEERSQLAEPLRACDVEAARPLAALAQQAGALQDRQVLGDRGPRHVEVGGDLTGGELAVTDESKDLAPARL
jgi:hypothetical protein